jgi:hypothetical protein
VAVTALNESWAEARLWVLRAAGERALWESLVRLSALRARLMDEVGEAAGEPAGVDVDDMRARRLLCLRRMARARSLCSLKRLESTGDEWGEGERERERERGRRRGRGRAKR